jgi:hypothetical protein
MTKLPSSERKRTILTSTRRFSSGWTVFSPANSPGATLTLVAGISASQSSRERERMVVQLQGSKQEENLPKNTKCQIASSKLDDYECIAEQTVQRFSERAGSRGRSNDFEVNE